MFWDKTNKTIDEINRKLTDLMQENIKLVTKVETLEQRFMSLNARVNRKLNYTLEQQPEETTESNLNEDGLGALRGI